MSLDPDRIQAIAAREQLWSSLPALRAEIEALANGQFAGTERERQIIQIVARIVLAEMEFRADDATAGE